MRALRVLCSFLLLAAALAESAIAADPPAFPSSAQQITITPKSATAASVTLALKPGAKLPADAERALGIPAGSGSSGRVTVSDLPLNFETLKKDQQRRDALAKRGVLVPVFQGREFRGWRQIARIDAQTITAAVAAKTPLDVPIDVLAGIPITIDPSRELLITDLGVVEDPARTFDACRQTGTPMGAWTFGRLMTDIANGRDASDMVEKWLRLWLTDQTVNTLTVPARPFVADFALNSWKRTSGKLDLAQAPMRLLAIVNRIDLRKGRAWAGGEAGEGRFVFGVLDPANCGALPLFTLILEYGVPKSGCTDVHAWAQQWHALGALKPGTPAFNTALQQITDTFARANASPAKPNGSALNQMRTDELELGTPWELREFRLDPAAHGFFESTVAQTPDIQFNANPSTRLLTDYINANQAALIDGSYIVPLKFPATGRQTPLLGGSAPNQLTYWHGIPPGISNEARHALSLGTCSGCHGRETNAFFTHILPREAKAPAALSKFLTGDPGTLRLPGTVTMSDPVDNSARVYGDLLNRQAQLDAIIGASCGALGVVQQAVASPLYMVH
ncbi:MAG: hypothetical protein ABW186_10000 [Rhodanobacteraceae bacterium]